MSVIRETRGKRASKAAFLFTTSAFLLVVLVSLSFPIPADAGSRPPYFKTKPLSPPPTPSKKSPTPAGPALKKPPSYVPSVPPKKPVNPMKPKSPPPPYTPDLTTAAKFTFIPRNWLPRSKLPPNGFRPRNPLNNPLFRIPPPPPDEYRLRNPPPRYRYRLTPPRYGWYVRHPPPRN